MIDLKKIPSDKESLDSYEVENIFQSWSYQPLKYRPGWFLQKGYGLPPRTEENGLILVPVLSVITSDIRTSVW